MFSVLKNTCEYFNEITISTNTFLLISTPPVIDQKGCSQIFFKSTLRSPNTSLMVWFCPHKDNTTLVYLEKCMSF